MEYLENTEIIKDRKIKLFYKKLGFILFLILSIVLIVPTIQKPNKQVNAQYQTWIYSTISNLSK
jgi:energy-converting hydrogenase Eha subunit H